MFATFLLGHWRLVAALAIISALAGYIETLRIERDVAYAAEATAKAELATFTAKVAAEGQKAENEKIAKEAEDKKNKESADAENSTALATLAGMLGRARSRPVSAPAACPSDPSRADRFRAESDGAYRDFVEGLRAEGERSSKAVIGLNTGKNWAQNTRKTP